MNITDWVFTKILTSEFALDSVICVVLTNKAHLMYFDIVVLDAVH